PSRTIGELPRATTLWSARQRCARRLRLAAGPSEHGIDMSLRPRKRVRRPHWLLAFTALFSRNGSPTDASSRARSVRASPRPLAPGAPLRASTDGDARPVALADLDDLLTVGHDAGGTNHRAVGPDGALVDLPRGITPRPGELRLDQHLRPFDARREGVRRHVARLLVLLEHAVELCFGLRAFAVTVVQVHHRPADRPLGGVRVERAGRQLRDRFI